MFFDVKLKIEYVTEYDPSSNSNLSFHIGGSYFKFIFFCMTFLYFSIDGRC